MSSKQPIAFVAALVLFSLSLAGCRNRCQPGCNPYQQPLVNQYGYNQYGYNAGVNQVPPVNAAVGRSPLIPPPATGTLNIPSIARNNPFGLNQNRGLLNTQQPAPTPANRAGQFNRQNGWQPVDGRSSGANGNQNQSNVTRPSASGTTLGNNNPAGQGGVVPANARSVLAQDTQSRANQGYGDSYVRSPDYSTTTVNETYDRTRLPATDASSVRAPSQYYARATGAQVAQLPGANTSGYQQPYYSGTFQAARSGVPAGNVFVASNQNAVVQGQSTATYDPYSNTRSADWRNRDINSDSFQ